MDPFRRIEPAHRRTFQPVHRSSAVAGGWEEGWFRAPPLSTGAFLQALKKFELAGRKPGRVNGPIGWLAIELAELLLNMAKQFRSRLWPSQAWLARKLKRSKSAVVAALARLRDLGVLEWVRRLVPVAGERGVRGPRVKQTTNVYRFALPRAIARLVKGPPARKATPTEVANQLRVLAERAEAHAKGVAKINAALERGRRRGSADGGRNASQTERLNPSLKVESLAARFARGGAD
ncbi:MAG TPA: hypothetical protein VGS12_09795 [Caulobacteraceae bacterium]|nr:hypothetical protein [Caulobacteraceae bacterium]